MYPHPDRPWFEMQSVVPIHVCEQIIWFSTMLSSYRQLPAQIPAALSAPRLAISAMARLILNIICTVMLVYKLECAQMLPGLLKGWAVNRLWKRKSSECTLCRGRSLMPDQTALYPMEYMAHWLTHWP